ncbi:MAG: TIGR01777 family oxidoreductase, partial [Pirellulales bacterium]
GWNPIEGPPPPDSFDGVDCVFHLAGESVAEGRWTTSQKAKIRDSRILGTKNLVSGILQNKTSVKKLISSSAVGFYGDRGEEELTESSPPGNDFLADVCIGWEREADIAREQGIRVVTMRTGIVLGAGGGALAKMLTPFRLGAGGPLGNGRQWMPWIHVADLARLYVHANENSLLDGPMNAVAPNPVRNSEFTKALATQLKRPAFMPAPYLGLRLVFGEFAKVLFASQKVVPQIALETGFGYQFPFLKEALEDILSV